MSDFAQKKRDGEKKKKIKLQILNRSVHACYSVYAKCACTIQNIRTVHRRYNRDLESLKSKSGSMFLTSSEEGAESTSYEPVTRPLVTSVMPKYSVAGRGELCPNSPRLVNE